MSSADRHRLRVALVQASHPRLFPRHFPALMVAGPDTCTLYAGVSSCDLTLSSGDHYINASTHSDAGYHIVDMLNRRNPGDADYSCSMPQQALCTLSLTPQEFNTLLCEAAETLSHRRGQLQTVKPMDAATTERMAALAVAVPRDAVFRLLHELTRFCIIESFRNRPRCSKADLQRLEAAHYSMAGCDLSARRGDLKHLELTYGQYSSRPATFVDAGHDACLQVTAVYANADPSKPDVSLAIQIDARRPRPPLDSQETASQPAVVITTQLTPHHIDRNHHTSSTAIDTNALVVVIPHHFQTPVRIPFDRIMDIARDLADEDHEVNSPYSQDAILRLLHMIADELAVTGKEGQRDAAARLKREIGDLQGSFSLLTRARIVISEVSNVLAVDASSSALGLRRGLT